MSIREAQVEDTAEIRDLIIKAVEPELNPDFDEEGIKLFYKPNDLSSIKSRILNKDYLTLCFIKDKKIAGLITIHVNEKIDQLFVAPSYRNLKISKKLWEEAKSICFNKGNRNGYWVKSSTVAVPIYESFGFRLDGERQKKNGIIYYPMVSVQ
ncbi:GNAT family N-acetyltransferase [Cognaticolwellia mytili]|uniref:GNAT family N-acetyltransferase n=1 Tax=Cognaticolwellia mytili TaxID=1888913 RepID=UPI000A17212C|nr:GNAT family N-acetyltransferase [Cognaticolwellia mytili]